MCDDMLPLATANEDLTKAPLESVIFRDNLDKNASFPNNFVPSLMHHLNPALDFSPRRSEDDFNPLSLQHKGADLQNLRSNPPNQLHVPGLSISPKRGSTRHKTRKHSSPFIKLVGTLSRSRHYFSQGQHHSNREEERFAASCFNVVHSELRLLQRLTLASELAQISE